MFTEHEASQFKQNNQVYNIHTTAKDSANKILSALRNIKLDVFMLHNTRLENIDNVECIQKKK